MSIYICSSCGEGVCKDSTDSSLVCLHCKGSIKVPFVVSGDSLQCKHCKEFFVRGHEEAIPVCCFCKEATCPTCSQRVCKKSLHFLREIKVGEGRNYLARVILKAGKNSVTPEMVSCFLERRREVDFDVSEVNFSRHHIGQSSGILMWEGQWTKGRWVAFLYSGDSGILIGCPGTGRFSEFLDSPVEGDQLAFDNKGLLFSDLKSRFYPKKGIVTPKNYERMSDQGILELIKVIKEGFDNTAIFHLGEAEVAER